jgi:hypothetical protein
LTRKVQFFQGDFNEVLKALDTPTGFENLGMSRAKASKRARNAGNSATWKLAENQT